MPKTTDEPTGFGQRLRALREEAGLTQAELAARIGYNQFSIAKLEQGIREPTWSTVLALCKALNVGCEAFQFDQQANAPPAAPRRPGRPKKTMEEPSALKETRRKKRG
jgi:transcriptional regulator with XRE-family HTH domain